MLELRQRWGGIYSTLAALRTALSLVGIIAATQFFTGCSREIVRPLQVNPNSRPQIVIFHHITYRTAPITYVIDFNEHAVEQWKSLTGRKTVVLHSDRDFKVSRAHLRNGEVFISSTDPLKIHGTLELASDSIGINLEIHGVPSRRIENHPIDGRYSLTKANAMKVKAAEIR